MTSGEHAGVTTSSPSPGAAWQHVFSGRYRITRWYDRDGRRYVAASRHPEDAAPELTERQQRVLGERAKGTALKVIAVEAGVSIGTVSRDLACAMARLGLGSSADLAAVLGHVADGGDTLPRAPLPSPRGLAVERACAGDDADLALSFPIESRPPAALTPAEREVIDGILAGLPNRAIAERRGVSPRTVANQIARIFAKLAVGSRLGVALTLQGSAFTPASH
ncbi:MAG TPA: LuxR C-terminal-related transcriptional regulator [Polyangiaceae bacterium]|nr:LuxR C-terminal-related transcriptional regulator [Polyangiaceae bacterium]